MSQPFGFSIVFASIKYHFATQRWFWHIIIEDDIENSSALWKVVFSTREQAFKQKRPCGYHRGNEAVNQRRAIPVLAHTHQQQADVGHEQNGAEQRDHFGLACEVLHRHRVEHQDEEGKAFQIAGGGLLHIRNDVINGSTFLVDDESILPSSLKPSSQRPEVLPSIP